MGDVGPGAGESFRAAAAAAAVSFVAPAVASALVLNAEEIAKCLTDVISWFTQGVKEGKKAGRNGIDFYGDSHFPLRFNLVVQREIAAAKISPSGNLKEEKLKKGNIPEAYKVLRTDLLQTHPATLEEYVKDRGAPIEQDLAFLVVLADHLNTLFKLDLGKKVVSPNDVTPEIAERSQFVIDLYMRFVIKINKSTDEDYKAGEVKFLIENEPAAIPRPL